SAHSTAPIARNTAFISTTTKASRNGCSGGLPPATTVISTIAVATVSPSTACTATLAPRTEEGGTGVVRSRRRNPDSRCIPKVWGIDITPVTVTENITIGAVKATIRSEERRVGEECGGRWATARGRG